MAKTALSTIKNWFKTGSKPTQSQFWNVFDSFFHKDEKLQVSDIDQLSNYLNQKAEKQSLNNHQTSDTAHQSLFDQKQDKEEGKGLSTNDFSDENVEKLEKIVLPDEGWGYSQANFTDEEKDKLAGFESQRWKGSFLSLADLQTAFPEGSEQTWHNEEGGWTADVDGGVEQKVLRYIWDANDSSWQPQEGGELKKVYNDENEYWSFGVDRDNVIKGGSSVVVGKSLTDRGFYSALLGGTLNEVETGNYYTGIFAGSENKIFEGLNYSVILGGGMNEIHSSYCGILSGRRNKILLGNFNTIIGGDSNKVNKGAYHVLSGYQNVTDSPYCSFVAGAYNHTKNNYSVIFGASNKESSVTNNYNGCNFISGNYNEIGQGSSNALFGAGLLHTGNHCLVVGQANVNLDGAESVYNSSTDARFIVGNGILNNSGEAKTRSNAFVILQSGLIYADKLTIDIISNSENPRTLITKEYLENALGNLPDAPEAIDNITEITNRDADDLQNKRTAFNKSFGYGYDQVLKGSDFRYINEAFVAVGETIPSRIPEAPASPESALPANVMGIQYFLTANAPGSISVDASITYDRFDLINNDDFEISLEGINGTDLRPVGGKSLVILPYGKVTLIKIGTYGDNTVFCNVTGDLKAN